VIVKEKREKGFNRGKKYPQKPQTGKEKEDKKQVYSMCGRVSKPLYYRNC